MRNDEPSTMPVSVGPVHGCFVNREWRTMEQYLALVAFAARVPLTLKSEPLRGFAEFVP